MFEYCFFSKLANVLAAAFLSSYKETFIAYAFTQEEMALNGAKRSRQRFEQCLRLLKRNAYPALKALEAQHLYDPSIQKDAADLASEAIRDYRNQIMLKVNGSKIRTEILKKMDLIKLVVMFPDEVLNVSRIDGIYEDLELDGSETFVKMYTSLSKHRKRLEKESKSSWIYVLSKTLKAELYIYNADLNILCKSTRNFYRL